MMTTHEIRHDGPYLHVTLPDVLPPDWVALRSDVDVEIEDGVERTFVNIPGSWLAMHDEGELVSFQRTLREQGIEVRVRRARPLV